MQQLYTSAGVRDKNQDAETMQTCGLLMISNPLMPKGYLCTSI